jgi:GNAT superfamily N-acetyltransferase
LNGIFMHDDILTLPLIHPLALSSRVHDLAVRRLRTSDRHSLAQLYLASYPPNVGSANLADAAAEMDSTLSGEYGSLRFDASFIALMGETPVGAVLTTFRSIWDQDLEGPFIIELFISPSHRHQGAGRLLVIQAIRACEQSLDPALSLRVGEGTSLAAFKLYEQLGFRRRSET